MKKIVLGSKNKDKLREIQALMKGAGVQALSLADFKDCPDVAETGKTFEANARLKARDYSKHTHLLTLADDSGLRVDALNGKPGVYSARFAGSGCTYHDNNQKLLALLKGKRRRAKFVCVMSLYDNGRCVNTVRGECKGSVAFSQRGKHGFGYDPIFIPRGFTKTFAELGPAVKNKISHRGKALRKVKK